MKVDFLQLNLGWNADPNCPNPQIEVRGSDVILHFAMNSFQFHDIQEDERGFLRFANCTKYRLGATNDEGWYLGQCRFSKLAPVWGEFYLVSGDPSSLEGPTDWLELLTPCHDQLHFLFYFRDSMFECAAESCCFDSCPQNALTRTSKLLPSLANTNRSLTQ